MSKGCLIVISDDGFEKVRVACGCSIFDDKVTSQLLAEFSTLSFSRVLGMPLNGKKLDIVIYF